MLKLRYLACFLLLLLPSDLLAQKYRPIGPAALTGANNNSAVNDIAYNDKQRVYLQVWGHPVVYGRFLSADGVPIGGGPFVIAAQSESDAVPRVAYSSDSGDDVFVVRFTSELNRGQYLYVRTVRYVNGEPAMGPAQMVYGGGTQIARAGGMAFDPYKRQFLLTWESPSGGWDVFAQLWQLSGSVSAPTISPATSVLNISEMNNAQGTPNVAFDWKHNSYMVVFRGENPASEFVKGSWARQLTFDGANNVTKSGPIELSSGFGEPAEQNVVYLPEIDGFLTLWTDITRVRDLSGKVVDHFGNAVGGIFPILATSSNEGAADADYSPYTRTVVVAAMRDGTRYAQGVELSAGGQVTDYFQATTALPDGPWESFFPHVAVGHDGRFAVSYVNGYHFVYTDILQGPVASGGHFPTPGSGGGTPPPPPPPPPPAPVSSPRMWIDSPANGARVSGDGFPITGWALDAGASNGTGVDVVHMWAYPVGGSPAIFLGSAPYGGWRGDVGAAFGSARFSPSGFTAGAQLSPGTYDIAIFPHSTVAGGFTGASVVRVTVEPPVSQPRMWVDTPAQGETTSTRIRVSGWALDLGSSFGTGVAAVHVWAYPSTGAAPMLVGTGDYGLSRIDVGNAFGSSRFNTSGFDVHGNLPPGDYTLVIYAYSSVMKAFNNTFVVGIRVR